MSSCRAVTIPEANSGAAAGEEKPRTYPNNRGASAVTATAMYTPSAEPPAPAAGGGSSGVTALSVAMRAARRGARALRCRGAHGQTAGGRSALCVMRLQRCMSCVSGVQKANVAYARLDSVTAWKH